MSTFKEIIERVDEYKLNSFSPRVKLSWLTALDGKIAADVFLMGIEEIRALPHRYPEVLECEPLAGYPHEDMYDLWLEAKIDYANGEYDKYQNTMEHYNECYGNFLLWFVSTYEPIDGCRSKLRGAYITAYGLAVKQGYRGTLDEWLLSLIGPKGDTGKSAYQYALESGYAGTEEEFRELQLQGKSAYNYAVDGGYTGTAEEFAAKLAAEYALKGHDHDDRYYTEEEAAKLLKSYAPAGYTEAYFEISTAEDFDSTLDTVIASMKVGTRKVIRMSSSGTNPLGGGVYMLTIDCPYANYAVVDIVGYTDSGRYRKRTMRNGVWDALEWANPPMVPGVEYRTTERYNGKPVYIRAIECGDAPKSGGKTVAHGVSKCRVIHCYGTCSGGIALPYTSATGYYVKISAHDTAIIMYSNYDNSMTGVVGIIKYWKSTD